MNTPRKIENESAQTPIFDPFPKPQTMPSGWDLSGLVPTPSLPAVANSAFDAES
jgi:hypothetical protein